MRIDGAVAVVTGASGGIGRATAHALAEQGARVVVTARRAEALADVVAECAEAGAEALAVPADVTDADALAEVARTARERFGALDIWVNCAAVSAFGLFEQTPMEVHRRVLEVNVLGYLHGAAAALPYLRERPRGVLVNVSSVIGVTPQPYTGAYTVSKAAVQAFSAVLRQELWLQGDRGVRVCAVLPAAIDTPVFRQAANYTGHAVHPISPRYRPQWVARSVVRVIRRPRAEVRSRRDQVGNLVQHFHLHGRHEHLADDQEDAIDTQRIVEARAPRNPSRRGPEPRHTRRASATQRPA
jgi:NAD(P)-dependent dehydrogenase (short-subunit alcohol dehydrogenase family)